MLNHIEKVKESTSAANGVVQQTPAAGIGFYLQDNRPKATVQKKQAEAMPPGGHVQRKNKTGLPDQLKSGIESLSGHSMDDVQVHYNSGQPAQLNAHAYAQGTDIHIAPGQEKHLPHETWHVVQQKQGRVRPTLQMKGKVNVNDDKSLEKEADVMGAKAQTVGPLNDNLQLFADKNVTPVVQRRMGIEVETRRTIEKPGGGVIEKGDTEIINHEYFKLVTDHFQKTSNLEFVMKHFDQLAGTEEEAIAELTRRLRAMKDLYDVLYANEGKLGDMVPRLGPTDAHQSANVRYREKRGARVNFDSADATIKAAPARAREDGLLYVHYTIGFHPRHWKKMITKIHGITRGDTKSNRPKTIAGHALEVANTYAGTGLTPDEREEARGHLALMYMQMNVWVDRTIDLDEKQAKRLYDKSFDKVRDLKTRIAEIDKSTMNLLEKDTAKSPLEEKLKKEKKHTKKMKNRLLAIQNAMGFGKGQVKNKIAALPRASLHQMFQALSPNVQTALKRDKDTIENLFSDTLEEKLNIDMNVGAELESGVQTASLDDFIGAGLGNGMQISQQVLFGGMNEVGIDNSSRHNPNLLPLEFRSINKKRISWAELLTDSIEILKYSRNP